MFKFLNLYIFKYLLLSFPVLFFVFLGFFAPQKTLAFTLSKPSLGPSLGMVGYWSFDGKDTVGGTIYDRSGNNNHGSALNYATSTFYIGGKIGQALNFDGVDDRVFVGDPADEDLDFGTGNFAISFWVYRDPSATSNARALAKGASDDTAPQAGYAFFANNNQMTFIINASAARVSANTGGNMSTKKWHHIVGIVDRDRNVVSIYLDSVWKDDTDIVGSGTVSSDNNFNIGSTHTPSVFWPGKIDDVRVYNRLLSASEITQLYKLGADTKQNVSIKPEPLSRGLVGHWSFDGKDIVGGTIYDRSGNGNNGSAVGYATTTFFSAGKIGQALNFDGVNDRVNLGDPSTIQFDIDDPFSTTFWVKAPLHNTGNNYIFLSKTNNVHGLGWYVWSWQSTDLVYFTIGTASGGGGPNYTVNSSSIIADNKWHYVTATYMGTSNQSGMKLYVDGVLVATGSNSAISTSILNANALTINGYDGTTYNTGIGPSIDDVRVYNRALSASEIKQLYNLGADTKQNVTLKPEPLSRGLVGYWSFDGKDTVGGTIYDRSGNGNNGSAVGYATTTFFSSGKIGQALNFDGVNDYVDIPITASVKGLSVVTVSAWVNPSSFPSFSGVYYEGRNADTTHRLQMYQLSSGNVYCSVRVPDGSAELGGSFGAGTLSIGKWTHLVCVYDPVNNKIYEYKDGTLRQTHTIAAGNGSFDNTDPSAITISRSNSTRFSGKIDDVRVYNRALSASEIKQLYNLGR